MTELKVVPLPPPTQETETVVATLEALLEVAKEGNLENFFFVAITRAGGAVSARSFEPHTQRYALIGAIEHRLKVLHRLLDNEAEIVTNFSPGGAA